MKTIELTEMPGNEWVDFGTGITYPTYMARVKDNHGMWGQGRSHQSAIGDLIMSFPEEFSIKLEEVKS